MQHDDNIDGKRATRITVYRLYGHYSCNSRDGGEAVTIVLSPGYTLGTFAEGGSVVVGPRFAMTIEQAIYHGFGRIVAPP